MGESRKLRVVDSFRAYSQNRMHTEHADDISVFTQTIRVENEETVVPARPSCNHPLCSLLNKKDTICAEQNKSLVNIKPKHDMVDTYQSDLKVE
jgi:hypothetical protein